MIALLPAVGVSLATGERICALLMLANGLPMIVAGDEFTLDPHPDGPLGSKTRR